MRRPVPLAAWFLALALFAQSAATLFAATNNQPGRARVMGVSAAILAVALVVVWIKRPEGPPS